MPQRQVDAGPSMATAQKTQEKELEDKRKEIMQMYKRLDGKPLGEKQVKVLLKEYEEAMKREREFDPRKHRLQHGIRAAKASANAFSGKGVKMA
mmetsp:Transcript_36976/g.56649  ORF Transcript_36976/g.56649 Transcript_36976/m.56649 type:complete len:94 (+) Transcript_36976:624-905(+)